MKEETSLTSLIELRESRLRELYELSEKDYGFILGFIAHQNKVLFSPILLQEPKKILGGFPEF